MFPSSIATSDGLTLHLRHWPHPTPKGVVVIVHGLGEHIARYEHVAATLNQAGYAAVGVDHRGHGRSGGDPRSYVANFDLYVDDLSLVWKETKNAYPDVPFFMLGHSMGAHIATRFALQNQAQLHGLAISGVAVLPGESIPKIAIQIGNWIGKLAPSLPLAALDSSAVSRDPAVVSAYQNDPLVYHGKLRAGMGLAMLSAGDDTLARASKLTLPLLVMHGESDQLVPKLASQKVYEAASSKDKTLKIYTGLYHEIMNEPEQAQVLGDIIAWLDAH